MNNQENELEKWRHTAAVTKIELELENGDPVPDEVSSALREYTRTDADLAAHPHIVSTVPVTIAGSNSIRVALGRAWNDVIAIEMGPEAWCQLVPMWSQFRGGRAGVRISPVSDG